MYYSSTTPYYKVLLQYYSVLQSKVLLQYYSVLQSTILYYKVVLQYYSSIFLYYKVLLQNYSVLQSTTPVLQYYSVLQSTTPVLLLVLQSTHLQGAEHQRHQPHQMLCLPRKVTLMIDPRHIWNVIYNAQSNRTHPPTSPYTAPAT